MEIIYQFRLLIIIFCDINIVMAVAGGEAGKIGLQKENQEFEKHENVESGLIKDANVSIRQNFFKVARYRISHFFSHEREST